MEKPRVLLSLPHTGSTHVATVTAVENMMLPDQRVELQVVRPMAVPVENNLNQVVKKFLEGDWDYWINLDNDQAPLKNPIDLVFLDKDVIGLPTPAVKFGQPGWENPFFWSVYTWDTEAQRYKTYAFKTGQGPMQEVDAVGAGCWVVARRVLEAIPQPMLREYDEHGIVRQGMDLAFCSRARARGFKIYAHYEYICRHFKEIDLYEVMQVLANARAN